MRLRATLAGAMICGVLSARFVAAQCSLPVLDPTEDGEDDQTRLDNYHALLDGLYVPGGSTRLRQYGGLDHQLPPWFDSSTDCTVGVLHGDACFDPTTFDDYLVSGDELSELMVVTSLGLDHDRMLALHRTVQAMIADSPFEDLPCVTARATSTGITCHPAIPPDCDHVDTASDVTARIALAYFQAASNPAFSGLFRDAYRQAGIDIAYAHLDTEYVDFPAGSCPFSAVTGQPICHWIGGGAHTAANSLSAMRMWIGYHQDIARMLLAAFAATNESTFVERAREVIDQWLVASTFDGTGGLTVGRTNFDWDVSGPAPQPKPGDSTYWDNDPAWDAADASRALWMGDVLRAVQLSPSACASGNAPPYTILRDWVGRMQVADGQPPNASCIQWNHQGTPFPANCGTDYYYNGLGIGLHMQVATAELEVKLDTALSQYDWDGIDGTRTWNSSACFGIYRGVRPMKALASAIGLDDTTYGGGRCGTAFRNLTPCRIVDTRATTPLTGGVARTVVASGTCGIPSSAIAIATNVTVTQPTTGGHLRVGPTSCQPPARACSTSPPGRRDRTTR